jgi:hypothetical protein
MDLLGLFMCTFLVTEVKTIFQVLQNSMNARKGDVDALRQAAVDLAVSQGHQQELRTIIEPQLIQLNCRWGELFHRICVSTWSKVLVPVGANI